jgi:outer membrane protein assembly factor BamB
MQGAPSESPRPAPGHRLWVLPVIALLVAGAIAIVQYQPELERNIKGWLTLALIALGLVLVLLWFTFLSRFPGRTRLLVVVGLGLAGVGLSLTLRVDGTISSIGFPRLAWKWNRPQPPQLDATPKPVAGAVTTLRIPDVPQFFGPNRDGIVTGARLARDWTATPPRELWRQPVGAGWSAFAVAGGRAFTQEQRGENEALTCYDALTGKLLWSLTHPAHFSQWQGGEGPRATPTVDRGLVFAYGATGILECAEAATGRRVWSREVLKDYKLENLEWGVSASPLVFAGTVVVTGGNTRGPTLLAFARDTGKPQWQSGTDRASYSSPVLTTLAGRSVVLSLNAASLTAHDAATGKMLLNYPWAVERVPKAAQPVVLAGDRVFISAGYGAGCVMLQITAGADHDFTATPLWKSLRMKNQFNSVAVRDGHLYGLDDGVLACLDAATGTRKWKAGRYGSGQSLIVDELVIVQMETGPVVLAEAKPDAFREFGRIEALSSKTWNHPTLAGRLLLVRNDREAVAYELPVE